MSARLDKLKNAVGRGQQGDLAYDHAARIDLQSPDSLFTLGASAAFSAKAL